MRRVLVFPLSGYANRLQAIASSAILADRLGASLSVCWDTEAVAPVPASAVFSADFCRQFVIDADAAVDEWGLRRSDVPRYLSVDASRSVITLAGHDLGEQHFMADLRRAIDGNPDLDSLVIAAGGKFYLADAGVADDVALAQFRALRQAFYGRMRLRDEIEKSAVVQREGRGPYIGLHLRYTDRKHQSPSDRAVRDALERSASESGLSDVFVAADSSAARDEWSERVSDLGLAPWSAGHTAFDRSAAGSEHAALVDWRLLGGAARLVYFAESSFAEEAAVASGHWDESMALPAETVRALMVRARRYATAARTYPRRHGWFGRD